MHGRSIPPAGRDLLGEFAAALGGWEWDVALLDIGGGTTDIVVFHGGAAMHTAVLPLGGNHLTSDVAAGLRTPLHEAEPVQVTVREPRPSTLQTTTAFDSSVRTEFIHAISATGIPPANPFFFPGHAQPLRYHYFWLILCSMVDVAGGAFVGARHAWIGGVIWCGAGFMALVALFFRLIAYRGPETFRRRTLVGILLLGVTGLDILPNAGQDVGALPRRSVGAFLPCC